MLPELTVCLLFNYITADDCSPSCFDARDCSTYCFDASDCSL